MHFWNLTSNIKNWAQCADIRQNSGWNNRLFSLDNLSPLRLLIWSLIIGSHVSCLISFWLRVSLWALHSVLWLVQYVRNVEFGTCVDGKGYCDCYIQVKFRGLRIGVPQHIRYSEKTNLRRSLKRVSNAFSLQTKSDSCLVFQIGRFSSTFIQFLQTSPYPSW